MEFRVRSVVGIAVAAALVSVGALVAVASPAGATTFTPTPDPTADGAPGSLRAAVAAATSFSGDEIDLSAGGTYTLTCAGGGQLIHTAFNTPLILSTPSGAPATIRQTCPGERVLSQGIGSLVLNNVIVTGGNLSTGFSPGEGGAITANGSVIVTNSTLSHNSTGALIADGGAISTAGSVAVTNSTLSNNSAMNASGGGGAISAPLGGVTVTNSTLSNNTVGSAGNSSGGAIVAGVGVTVTSSTLSNNTSIANGAAWGGALTANTDVVTVTKSTLSNNTARSVEGNQAEGGAIRAFRPVAVTSSTLSNNTSTSNGGLAEGGAITDVGGPPGAVSLTNSTVSNNTARSQFGGIYANSLTTVYSTVVSNSAPIGANVELLGGSGALTSFATVVALPLGGGANCTGVVGTTSNGFNFSDDTSCGLPAGETHVGVSPQLGGLADNGGPTQTLLPQPGSPLIDAIPNASCPDGASGITTDQRGLPRPDAGSPACDIGAVEVQPPVPSVPISVPNAPTAVAITPRFTG
jgi:hypothetical protein